MIVMKRSHSALVQGFLIVALVCAGTACDTDFESKFNQWAIDDIAGRLRSPAAGLKPSIEATRNTHGGGIIVFVRSASGCHPRFAWIWVNAERRFALDEMSRQETPTVKTLNEATPEDFGVMGLEAGTALQTLLKDVCSAS
jgi:hypothetical protein